MDKIQRSVYDAYTEWHNRSDDRSDVSPCARPNSYYLEIPISQDVFELPAIAHQIFYQKQSILDQVDMIAYQMRSVYYVNHKTPASGIPTWLHQYKRGCLAKFDKGDNQNTPYYVAYGTILDKDFQPVVMLSWSVKKVCNLEGVPFRYYFIKPLLRISPRVIIEKSNPVERYIVNQLLPKVLDLYVPTPAYCVYNALFGNAHEDSMQHPQAIIDEIPFQVRKVEAPSVSTTNRELLDVALEHIDEVIQ